jgi:hypothetical protein
MMAAGAAAQRRVAPALCGGSKAGGRTAGAGTVTEVIS